MLLALVVIGWFNRRPDALAGLWLPPLLLLAWAIGGGMAASWELPSLQGFNFTGGFRLPPELLALWLGISIYTSAFISEAVRGAILGVPHGQEEAAESLGLTGGQTMFLVVLPQALRLLIPPLTSNYLNIIKSTTLGAAIAYPDVFQIFGRTVLNQSGRAVEVMALLLSLFLAINLATSGLMNRWNRRLALQGGDERGSGPKCRRFLSGDGATPARACGGRSTWGQGPRRPAAVFGARCSAPRSTPALTIAIVGVIALTVPPFLNWAIAHATWAGVSRKACAPDGACWAFIRARLPLFVYGRYPEPERWRVDLAFVLLILVGAPALFARRRQGLWLAALLLVVPPAGGVLLAGGVLGMPAVSTNEWGGLMLNVVLTFATIVGRVAARGRAGLRPPLRRCRCCAGARPRSSNSGAACRC